MLDIMHRIYDGTCRATGLDLRVAEAQTWMPGCSGNRMAAVCNVRCRGDT